MKKLTKALMVISIANLMGCQSAILPNLAETKSVTGTEVKYLIPTEYLTATKLLGGLKIEEFYSSDNNEQEKLYITNIDQDTFAVNRTIANSVSGARKILYVDYSSLNKGNNTEITMTPTHVQHLQEGKKSNLLFSELNIVDTLSKSQFTFEFEVSSPKKPFTVQSNLNTTLKPYFYRPNAYDLESLGFNGFMVVESSPTNSGSKLTIQATLKTTKSEKNVIDIAALVDSLKRELKASIS